MITAKNFAKAQIEAGCDIISIGDAICSQISPDMYSRLALPLHRELFSYIQSKGALVKIHICGNITHLLPHLKLVRPDIVDIDGPINMQKAFETVGNRIILCGKINPVVDVLQQNDSEVFEIASHLIEQSKGNKLILSAGCEIPTKTPLKNIKVMRSATRIF